MNVQPRTPPLPHSLLRDLLVMTPSGVTVVTAAGEEGEDHAMTVSAYVPVSLDPPLVLVCISRLARMHDVLGRVPCFAVNVLGTGAVATARRFASSALDRFEGVEVDRSAGGLPLLRDAVARLECRTVRRYWGGDHAIFVGQVEGGSRSEGEPLVYMAHAFGHAELRRPQRVSLTDVLVAPPLPDHG
jgi:flavin reductase (DIM6/NTAB) family NADH-FMN oxidoreductase RutF